MWLATRDAERALVKTLRNQLSGAGLLTWGHRLNEQCYLTAHCHMVGNGVAADVVGPCITCHKARQLRWCPSWCCEPPASLYQHRSCLTQQVVVCDSVPWYQGDKYEMPQEDAAPGLSTLKWCACYAEVENENLINTKLFWFTHLGANVYSTNAWYSARTLYCWCCILLLGSKCQ